MANCRCPIEIELDVSVPHIEFSVSSNPAVELGISTAIEVSETPSPIPEYTGSYEVTPHFREQMLATNGYRMTDDVTVHTIPVVRTSNPQGGQTVLIG